MKVAADLAYPDELYTSTMSSSFNDLTNNRESKSSDIASSYTYSFCTTTTYLLAIDLLTTDYILL